MEASEARKRIEEHREAIDALDERLVALINERVRHSLLIRNLKLAAGMELFDGLREEAILNAVCAASKGPLSDTCLREVYTALLKVSKETPSLSATAE